MYKLLYNCIRLSPKANITSVGSVAALCNSRLNSTFEGVTDRYKGVTVDLLKEKCDQIKFAEILEESLTKWTANGSRCIWFKVNIQDAYCVPLLAQKGFTFHHARDNFVMMYKWLPKDSTPNLPPSCHTNLGVGAMVFNKKDQLLAISEKHYEYPHWKLPGGYVERGEDIIKAGIREVKEETGVDATFQSLVTLRHSHNMMFGNSDIYLILMMSAVTEEIEVSQREVNNCQWMDVEEYCQHPHVHHFNRFVVRKALEYKNRNLKLDIEKKIVQFGPNTRDMNYLVIKGY